MTSIVNLVTRKLIIALVLYKIVFFLSAFIVLDLVPLENRSFDLVPWPSEDERTLIKSFAAWDGANYLMLSKTGYHKNSPQCAFYPLWPFLIMIFSPLTGGNLFLAGIFLANILSFAGILLFHHFVTTFHDDATADLSVLFLLAFPGAIFFSFIYTEALFFLLIILFFLYLLRRNYAGAALIGFLLPLTKAIGVFCLCPLVWHLLRTKERWTKFWACSGPLLGYLAYFVVMYAFTGDPFDGFAAQQHFPNQPSIGNIVDISGFLTALFTPSELHGMTNSILDRFFFVICAYCLFTIARLNSTYFVYAMFVGIVPAMSSWFLSYSRHVMICFPMFIVLALALREERLWLIRAAIVLLLGVLQICFLILYLNCYWVA